MTRAAEDGLLDNLGPKIGTKTFLGGCYEKENLEPAALVVPGYAGFLLRQVSAVLSVK